MRIAYLDCASGISGDMTLAALVDAGVDFDALAAGVHSLGLPGARLVRSEVKRHGFRATKIDVEHEPEHKHRHLHHITAILDASPLPTRQKEIARRIFAKLAAAEAKVHGSTIEKVHFHEAGAVDSICDIVGAAIGWDLLGAERIACSPIPTGTGFVEIAHGRCSIPAPATAELLAGVPLATSTVPFELTTPTGAAIVQALVNEFGPVPTMKIDRIGYGAGQRDLTEQPNLLRLIVGESDEPSGAIETVCLLETNLDDSSGEVLGHAITQLWDAGALDVYTTPIQMKKNRPGVILSVMCRMADAQSLENILFLETTTLGVRRTSMQRTVLQREPLSVQTPFGQIAGKVAHWQGSKRFSPEYEACRAAAAQHHAALQVVFAAAQRAWEDAQ